MRTRLSKTRPQSFVWMGSDRAFDYAVVGAILAQIMVAFMIGPFMAALLFCLALVTGILAGAIVGCVWAGATPYLEIYRGYSGLYLRVIVRDRKRHTLIKKYQVLFYWSGLLEWAIMPYPHITTSEGAACDNWEKIVTDYCIRIPKKDGTGFKDEIQVTIDACKKQDGDVFAPGDVGAKLEDIKNLSDKTKKGKIKMKKLNKVKCVRVSFANEMNL